MRASKNGHPNVVRTLLEAGVNVNAQTKVSNQMMMMIIIIIILLTILIMMMMIVVINDEDGDDCR